MRSLLAHPKGLSFERGWQNQSCTTQGPSLTRRERTTKAQSIRTADAAAATLTVELDVARPPRCGGRFVDPLRSPRRLARMTRSSASAG